MNNEFKTDEIYKRIAENEVTLEQCLLTDRLPCVNFGRQAGHSTAIIKYVRDNPNLKFVILSPNKATHLEYAHHLSNGRRYSNFVRKYKHIPDDVDYIIIDTVYNLYERVYWLEEHCRGKEKLKKARIIQVGY